MRSTQSSALKMVLIFTPLIAIPLLAIFGIPEFPSVSASPSDDPLKLRNGNLQDPGIGQSQKYVPHDLFAPIENDLPVGQQSSPAPQAGSNWNDPFNGASANVSNPSAPRNSNQKWSPPPSAMNGWEVDRENLLKTGAPIPDRGNPLPSQGSPVVQNTPDGFLPTQPPAERSVENVPDQNWQENETNPLPEQFSQPTQPPVQNPFVQEQPRGEVPFGEQASIEVMTPPEEVSPAPFFQEQTQPKQPASPPQALPQTPSLTWQEASNRLAELGIKNYHLAPPSREGEGYYFSCFVTPANNPRITHRFEAEASEPLQAIQRVLAQVEEWQQRQ